MRLELTKDQPRANAVIKAVAEMSDFKKQAPRPRHGHRVLRLSRHACRRASPRSRSTRRRGKIKVHNYWIAVDPGLVIQPDNVHAQLESAVIYGLSAALIEELAVKDGAVQADELRQLSTSCA